MEQKELLAIKTFARRNKIDADRSDAESIRKWIYSVKEIIKKDEKMPENDTRRFFS